MNVVARIEQSERAVPAASLAEIGRVLEETARLVRQHARTAGEKPGRPPLPGTGGIVGPADDPRHIRNILDVRAMRREFLGFEASDAALAMLLALYAARLEGRRLHQTALAVAAGVPQTTALRITHRHLEHGTFESGPDPEDRRLMVIALSETAAARLRAYLAATAAATPLLA